jgi:putative transposase
MRKPGYRYIYGWGVIHNTRHARGRAAANRKRIYRIMRDNNLLLPQRSPRRNDTQAHDGRVAVDESDIRWSSDGFDVACWNKERICVTFTQDCCDREAISCVTTTRGIDAILVKDMLVAAIEQRFGQICAVPKPI